MRRLLRPGGLFLNHGITHPAPGRYSTGMSFLWRHVFPGADFERIGHVVARMEAAGFRILDVEGLGGHYARTTRQWLARLQDRAPEARALVGERAYRTWIAYLAAAAVAFRAGWIDVHQVLARRPDPSAAVAADTRESIYRA
jgi:cyclopropane-fatty-acyl-phospholipid synthase